MTDAQVQRANGKRMRGTATLIATDAPSDAIAAILCAQGLKTTTFERVEDLPDRGEHDDPSVVVLWAQDTSTSPASVVGPLTQRFERTPVVVVCAEIDRWEVRAALAAGAAGIVLHENLDSALGPCLRAVLAGQTCVPREHWRQIEPPALSAREKQILGLVVMGYMNGQIAEQLFLAESTVKSHLSSAFGKLGVRSRNEAANLILDPERGLGMGILALGGEPLEPVPTSSGPIVSGSSAEGDHAKDLQGVREQRGLTLQLDGFAYETIDEEAARQGVAMEELITFAVLYYLADVDSGRIARQTARSPYPDASRGAALPRSEPSVAGAAPRLVRSAVSARRPR